VTAEQRLAEAETRLETVEADCQRLRDLARHLVATVELLAEAAGAKPYRLAEPARPQLRVLPGGAS